MQGMRQLQQAYLEKKDGPEQEVIKGALSCQSYQNLTPMEVWSFKTGFT